MKGGGYKGEYGTFQIGLLHPHPSELTKVSLSRAEKWVLLRGQFLCRIALDLMGVWICGAIVLFWDAVLGAFVLPVRVRAFGVWLW